METAHGATTAFFSTHLIPSPQDPKPPRPTTTPGRRTGARHGAAAGAARAPPRPGTERNANHQGRRRGSQPPFHPRYNAQHSWHPTPTPPVCPPRPSGTRKRRGRSAPAPHRQRHSSPTQKHAAGRRSTTSRRLRTPSGQRGECPHNWRGRRPTR
jgi:hypothetical protein